MTAKKDNSKSGSTISTSALINEVATKFDSIPKKITKAVISSFLESIEENLANSNKVRVDKLGILQVKDRLPRMGRNPQTGEAIKIPASKKVSFRVASSFKEAVGIKKKSATTAKTTKAPAVKKKK